MRSCFSSAEERCTKTTKQGQVFCLCQGSFCNGAPTAARSEGLAAAFLLLCLLQTRC